MAIAVTGTDVDENSASATVATVRSKPAKSSANPPLPAAPTARSRGRWRWPATVALKRRTTGIWWKCNGKTVRFAHFSCSYCSFFCRIPATSTRATRCSLTRYLMVVVGTRHSLVVARLTSDTGSWRCQLQTRPVCRHLSLCSVSIIECLD